MIVLNSDIIYLVNKELAALIFLTTEFNSFLTGSFGMSRINNQVDIFGELDLRLENFTKTLNNLK